jgi:hypothetical protein
VCFVVPVLVILSDSGGSATATGLGQLTLLTGVMFGTSAVVVAAGYGAGRGLARLLHAVRPG